MEKLTFEFVKAEFSKAGFTLINEEYIRSRAPLKYICDKHPEKVASTSWAEFKDGTRCRSCKGEERRLNIDTVRAMFQKEKCELITSVYIRNNLPLEFLCHKHPNIIQTRSLSDFQRSGCTSCNREAQSENLSGENHHNWKGGKNSENQKGRYTSEYKKWKAEVLERDNYTCTCCGLVQNEKLEVHHIESFSENEELRTELSNGMTMCAGCHSVLIKGSFHNTYGTLKNTKKQLEGYLETKNTYFKGVFSYEENKKGVLEKWHRM